MDSSDGKRGRGEGRNMVDVGGGGGSPSHPCWAHETGLRRKTVTSRRQGGGGQEASEGAHGLNHAG